MPTSAIFLVALLSSAAGPQASHTTPDVVLVADDGGADGELGFVDKYFPLSLNDDLDPSTDDLIVPFWLSHIFLPFAWLWAPYAFADVRPGKDFVVDALLIVVFHALASACLFPVVLLPLVGLLLFFPVMIFNLVNGFYLIPVAVLNAYDRSIKQDGGSSEKSDAPKKRKRRKRQEARLPQGLTTASMAF